MNTIDLLQLQADIERLEENSRNIQQQLTQSISAQQEARLNQELESSSQRLEVLQAQQNALKDKQTIVTEEILSSVKAESLFEGFSLLNSHLAYQLALPQIRGDIVELDVPHDDNCLFWVVVMNYLLPVCSDSAAFKDRFAKLFGEQNHYEHIQQLLKNYQPYTNAALTFENVEFKHLVRNIFRSRIVDYIANHRALFEPYIEDDQTWNDYLAKMYSETSWGGQIEIAACSKLLECFIRIFGQTQSAYGEQFQPQASINLVYVNSNHYHFLIAKNHVPNYMAETLMKDDNPERDNGYYHLYNTYMQLIEQTTTFEEIYNFVVNGLEGKQEGGGEIEYLAMLYNKASISILEKNYNHAQDSCVEALQHLKLAKTISKIVDKSISYPDIKVSNSNFLVTALPDTPGFYERIARWKKKTVKHLLLESFFIKKLVAIFIAEDEFIAACGLINYLINISNKLLEFEPSSKRITDLKSSYLQDLTNLSEQFTYAVLDTKIAISNKVHDFKSELNTIRKDFKKQLASIQQQHGLSAFDSRTEENLTKQLARSDAIFELYRQVTKRYKEYITNLFNYCIELLGQLPCEFCLISFGSSAQYGCTPFSDFEYGILIAKDDSNGVNKTYFRKVAKLFQFLVICLGETIVPALAIKLLNDYESPDADKNWFYDEVTKRGLSLDGAMPHACKTALGRQGYKEKKDFELIHTVDGMLALLKSEGYERELHLTEILTMTAYIEGSKELFKQYKDRLKESLEKNHSETGQSYFAYYGRNSLKDFIDSIQLDLINPSNHGTAWDIKKHIYRPFDRSIYALNMLCQKPLVGQEDKFIALEQILGKEPIKDLKICTAISLEMRLTNYLSLAGQYEKYVAVYFIHSKAEAELFRNENIYLDTEFKLLFYRLYFTIFPYLSWLKNLLKTYNLIIREEMFYNNDEISQLIVDLRLHDYKKLLDLELDKIAPILLQADNKYLLITLVMAAWQIGYHDKLILALLDAMNVKEDIPINPTYADSLMLLNSFMAFMRGECQAKFSLETLKDKLTADSGYNSFLTSLVAEYFLNKGLYQEVIDLYQQCENVLYLNDVSHLSNLCLAYFETGFYNKGYELFKKINCMMLPLFSFQPTKINIKYYLLLQKFFLLKYNLASSIRIGAAGFDMANALSQHNYLMESLHFIYYQMDGMILLNINKTEEFKILKNSFFNITKFLNSKNCLTTENILIVSINSARIILNSYDEKDSESNLSECLSESAKYIQAAEKCLFSVNVNQNNQHFWGAEHSLEARLAINKGDFAFLSDNYYTALSYYRIALERLTIGLQTTSYLVFELAQKIKIIYSKQGNFTKARKWDNYIFQAKFNAERDKLKFTLSMDDELINRRIDTRLLLTHNYDDMHESIERYLFKLDPLKLNRFLKKNDQKKYEKFYLSYKESIYLLKELKPGLKFKPGKNQVELFQKLDSICKQLSNLFSLLQQDISLLYIKPFIYHDFHKAYYYDGNLKEASKLLILLNHLGEKNWYNYFMIARCYYQLALKNKNHKYDKFITLAIENFNESIRLKKNFVNETFLVLLYLNEGKSDELSKILQSVVPDEDRVYMDEHQLKLASFEDNIFLKLFRSRLFKQSFLKWQTKDHSWVINLTTLVAYLNAGLLFCIDVGSAQLEYLDANLFTNLTKQLINYKKLIEYFHNDMDKPQAQLSDYLQKFSVMIDQSLAEVVREKEYQDILALAEYCQKEAIKLKDQYYFRLALVFFKCAKSIFELALTENNPINLPLASEISQTTGLIDDSRESVMEIKYQNHYLNLASTLEELSYELQAGLFNRLAEIFSQTASGISCIFPGRDKYIEKMSAAMESLRGAHMLRKERSYLGASKAYKNVVEDFSELLGKNHAFTLWAEKHASRTKQKLNNLIFEGKLEITEEILDELDEDTHLELAIQLSLRNI